MEQNDWVGTLGDILVLIGEVLKLIGRRIS
jgi:hypothetical protein